MLGTAGNILFTLCLLLCSCNAAELHKTSVQNDDVNTIGVNNEPGFSDKPKESYINPVSLKDVIPETTDLDRYYRYKAMQSISPFENSDAELKPLLEVAEDKDVFKESKYVVSNAKNNDDNTQNINLNENNRNFEANNFGGDPVISEGTVEKSMSYNSEVIAKDSSEAPTLIRENNSNLETGIKSKAQAFLSVNNVTIDDFYENRGNKSTAQYESEIDQLLQNNSNIIVGDVKSLKANKHMTNSSTSSDNDNEFRQNNVVYNKTYPDKPTAHVYLDDEDYTDNMGIGQFFNSAFNSNGSASNIIPIDNMIKDDDNFDTKNQILGIKAMTVVDDYHTSPQQVVKGQPADSDIAKPIENNLINTKIATEKDYKDEQPNEQDLTTQYVSESNPSMENHNLRSSDKPYVLHTSNDRSDRIIDDNQEISELRSDIHASLDDIAQRLIWKSSYPEADVSRTNREELEIINITGIADVALGDGVHSWKSISLWHQNYLVGISASEVILLRTRLTNGYIEYKMLHSIPIRENPSSFDIFRLRFESSVQSVALVSLDNQILWYKISPGEQLVEIWQWLLHSTIRFMKFIQIQKTDHLFTLEDFGNGEFTAHLYEFSIDRKQFWLRQRIFLECEANVAAFNFVADLIYLAIPQEQNNIVIIYKFVDGRFLPYQNIESSGVNFVSAFSVGHKSFLGVGGLDHALYRVDISGIHIEAILDSTFDNVQFYLPIHVKNYRDDLIVLVQHEIDHDSHSSVHVEALIWTENGFVTHSHEVCDDHGHISYGYQCLLDIETETGLIGSVAINHGRRLHIITPRSSMHSEVYEINTRLVQTIDPRREELNHLYKIRNTLEDNFKHQSQIIIEAKTALENSLNNYGDALVKTEWFVREIETPVYREENNEMQWVDGFLGMANIKFTKEDTNIHIPTLVEESDRILASVLDMPFLMKDGVKKKDLKVQLAQNLTINGRLRIEGGWKAESLCVGDINGESFNDLFHRLIYDKQTIQYNGNTQFDKVYVDNLFVDFINNYPVSNILYKSPETIVQGNLNFFNEIQFDHVYVKSGGTINEIKFGNLLRADHKINRLSLDAIDVLTDFKVRKLNGFIIDENELSDATNARQQRDINDVKEIRVLGDTVIESINGMSWKKFISKVVWKNSPRSLNNKMVVIGDIICSEPCLLHMPIINDLSFPSDFVLLGKSNENNDDFINVQIPPRPFVIVPNAQDNYMDSVKLGIFAERGSRSKYNYNSTNPEIDISGFNPESHFITGQKVFKQLNIKNLDCPGLVNGVNTEDVITLQGEQNIKGLITFENLKVTEGLHVGGSLTGKYLDNFTANPTLKDTNIIHSNVIFKQLAVQGPIYVQNINDTNLASILNDVVYNYEDEAIIHGYKYFENTLNIRDNLELTSNRINGIDTVDILTKNTEQILTVQNLHGDISFQDLTLTGFVDQVNLTDLFISTVKLQGDQYISSDITFNGKVHFENININNLLEKPVDDLITIDQPVYINSDAEFDKLIVETLYVDNLLVESKSLCGQNLKSTQEKCLSLTKPQYITADYHVDFVNANNATSSNINVIPPEIYLRKRRNVTQTLNLDYSEIYELIVDGEITTDNINGYNFKDIVDNAIWLNEENLVYSNLHFMDGFDAPEVIVKGLVNGYDFNAFAKDLVTASDDISIHATKTFTSDLVTDSVIVNKINNIRIENILTKNNEQSIETEFIIHGDVVMDNAECTEYFNGVSIEELKNRYSYEDTFHVIHGDAVFQNLTFIDSLLLDNVNGVNLHNFLPRLILTTDNTAPIEHPLNFENDVFFENALRTGTINSINLNNFVEDLVFIDRESKITCPVVFEKDVVFAGDLKIERDITTRTLSGCNTEFWKENRISIKDGASISGNKVFLDINSPEQGWTARTLNGHDLSTVFTLNTDQIIPYHVNFDNVLIQENCEIEGSLNRINLLDEVSNTLKVTSDYEQVIEAVTSFEYVHVRDSLEISAQINSKYNLQNVITLDSDQIIYTPGHVFETVLVPILDINGTVSGVDFNEWTANALRRTGNDQTITGHWYIDTADFQHNILGNNMLNNRDMHNLADEVAKQKFLLDIREKELRDEYTSFCLDVRYLLNLSNKYLYLLKYFEETQCIQDNIISMHVFKDGNGYSLITNQGSCKSTIYKWNSDQKLFTHAYFLETGTVEDWINVDGRNGSKFIVSRSAYDLGCDIPSGTNVWYIENIGLKHVFKLGPGIREILDGSDGTFYTVDEFGVKEYVLGSFNSDLQMSGSWKMYTDESTFVPREAGFDLSLSDGKRVTKLSKTNNNLDQLTRNIFGSEPVIGRSLATYEISTTECPYLPKRGNGEVEVLTVGLGSSLRQMVAVSVLENATVGGNYDFIKIYDDVMEGRLFQTLPCLRPSSLVSIHFGQGQTILAFIEDRSHIKIYDYRGIEGFIHLYTFNIPATRLSTVVLPINKDSTSSRHFLIASGPEGLRVLEALMHGDRINIQQELQCKKP